MSKETGGQAFPQQQWEYDGQNNVLQYQEEGMTLRDYFAAKAMQGLITGAMSDGSKHEQEAIEPISAIAYQFADAMIKARNT